MGASCAKSSYHPHTDAQERPKEQSAGDENHETERMTLLQYLPSLHDVEMLQKSLNAGGDDTIHPHMASIPPIQYLGCSSVGILVGGDDDDVVVVDADDDKPRMPTDASSNAARMRVLALHVFNVETSLGDNPDDYTSTLGQVENDWVQTRIAVVFSSGRGALLGFAPDNNSSSPLLKRLDTFHTGHGARGVSDVYFPADGQQRMYSCSADGSVRLRSLLLPSLSFPLIERLDSPIWSLSVNCDGEIMCVGCDDGSIRMYRLAGVAKPHNPSRWRTTADGSTVPTTANCATFVSAIYAAVNNALPCKFVRFHPHEATLVAVGSPEAPTVRLWFFNRHFKLCDLRASYRDNAGGGHRWVCGMKWAPDGQHLAVSGIGGTSPTLAVFPWVKTSSNSVVDCVRYRGPREVIRAIEWDHRGGTSACTFHPLLFGASVDRRVYVWSDVSQWPQQVAENHNREVTALAIAKHGRLLASGSSNGHVVLSLTRRGVFAWLAHEVMAILRAISALISTTTTSSSNRQHISDTPLIALQQVVLQHTLHLLRKMMYKESGM